MTVFGDCIRNFRKAEGKSICGLARELGISHTYLSEVENGARGPLDKKRWATLLDALPALSREELVTAFYLDAKVIDVGGVSSTDRVAIMRIIERPRRTLTATSYDTTGMSAAAILEAIAHEADLRTDPDVEPPKEGYLLMEKPTTHHGFEYSLTCVLDLDSGRWPEWLTPTIQSYFHPFIAERETPKDLLTGYVGKGYCAFRPTAVISYPNERRVAHQRVLDAAQKAGWEVSRVRKHGWPDDYSRIVLSSGG